jgi:hypothetical protein
MFKQFEGEKDQNQLEAGFEVSKILAQNGIDMKQPAIAITYGQIAEKVGNTLAEYGLTADRLSEEDILSLVQKIKEYLGSEDILSWPQVVHDITENTQAVAELISVDDNQIGDDCPLDGDEGSALASAGFGTDEDYPGGGDLDF